MLLFRRARARAILAVCLLSAVCSVFPATAKTTTGDYSGDPALHPGAVWIAHRDGITRLATLTNEPRIEIALSGVQALATDAETGNVWVYSESGLQGYDPEGQALLAAPMPLPRETASGRGRSAPTREQVTALAVDGRAGIVWLAAGEGLYRVGMGGTWQGRISAGQAITGLALDRQGSRLWVSGEHTLSAYTADGAVLVSRDFPPATRVHGIAFDNYEQQLWVLAGDRVQAYTADGSLRDDIAAPFRPAPAFVAPDGQGGLWFANNQELAYLTPAGGLAFLSRPFHDTAPGAAGPRKPGNNSVPPAHGGRILHLAADPWDHSAWVANHAQLRQIHTDGMRGHEHRPAGGPPPRHIAHLALYADIDPPRLWITAPAADSYTNNNRPPVELAYQDIGSGVDGASIRLRVDGELIQVVCLPEAFTALCTPQLPLLDGYLRLEARVADYAFNEAEPATRHFTVDTVPPEILLDYPTPDLLTNQPKLTLRGRVEELNFARLTLNGAVLVTGIEHRFSQTVTLQEGENTFVLEATDLAGNRSTLVRSVTLDTVPPEITVTEPVAGHITNQAGLTLAGGINEPGSLSLNGFSVTLDEALRFSTGRTLENGLNQFTFAAQDLAGNRSTVTRAVTLDNRPPAAPDTGLISIGPPDENGEVTITGAPGSVEPGSTVIITIGGAGTFSINGGSDAGPALHDADGNVYTAIADRFGGFSIRVHPEGGALELHIRDLAGNLSSGVNVTVPEEPEPPTAVGALDGEFSVDPAGAANYKIDIGVPPGVAGMQPDLAFLYSSRGGNGQLGVGWSLSGLSAVTRCPRTLTQDGESLGVTFDQTDRFCLDGQRLVNVSGKAYGANGAEYRTELDSFQRVYSYGAQQGAPQKFHVEDKAGLVREYGYTADSRVEAGGTEVPQLWAVNKIRDRFGNYIAFEYGKDNANGEYWPERISWHNANGTLIGKIEFAYQARDDWRRGYQYGGTVSTLTKRLTRVNVFAGTQKTAVYHLRYQYGEKTGNSQLAVLQRCTGDGECLKPTVFDWSQGDTLFVAWRQFTGNLDNLKIGDIDGDGRADLLYTRDGKWRIRFAGENFNQEHNTDIGTAGRHNAHALVMDIDNDGYQDFLIPSDGIGGGGGGGGDPCCLEVQSADTSSEGFWVVYRSTGGTLDNKIIGSLNHYNGYKYAVPVDINSDGLPELVFRRGGKLAYYLNEAGVFTFQGTNFWLADEQKIHPIEFDGDGRVDLFITTEGSNDCAAPDDGSGGGGGGGGGDPGDPPIVVQSASTGTKSCYDTAGVLANSGDGLYKHSAGSLKIETVLPLDVNGDGLIDLASHRSIPRKEWVIHLNKGSDYDVFWTGFMGSSKDKPVKVLDYNGDGKQDLMHVVDGKWQVLQATLGGFRVVNTGISAKGAESAFVGSFGGDGLPDLMYPDGGWKISSQAGGQPDLLISTENAFGETTRVFYASLAADPSLYLGHDARGLGSYEPAFRQVRNFLGPITVVRSFGADAGANNKKRLLYTRYRYGGAKLDQHGRGFLGFYEVEAHNENTNIVTRNFHRQDFPFTGMVEKAVQQVPDIQRLKEYDKEDIRQRIEDDLGGCDPDSGICFEPRMSPASTGEPVLPQGSEPGQVLEETVNEFGVRSWGGRHFPFMAKSTVSHFDFDSGALYKREITTYQYDDNGRGVTFGNAERVTVVTDDGRGGDRHVTDTLNNYYNDTAHWCLSRLTDTTVTHTLPDGRRASRRSNFEYAAAPTCQLVAESVEPDNPELWQTTRYGFDSFGNRVSETISGAGIEPRTTRTTYDARGLFPVRVENALGHAETRAYDARFGVKTAVTGPNGLTTRWSYDGFGRRLSEQDPRPGVFTDWEYAWCEQHGANNCVSPDAVWRRVQTASNGQLAIAEYDRLGREVVTRGLSFDGRFIASERHYDLKGREYAVSLPYYEDELNEQARCWAFTAYDNANRVQAEYRPANAAECNIQGGAVPAPHEPPGYGNVSQFAYAGLSVFSADGQGRVTARHENVAGRLARVEERAPVAPGPGTLDAQNPPPVYTQDGLAVRTLYQYDPFGNTERVTDAAGNTTVIEYDVRGRKTRMNDPDMDEWAYRHNALGELVYQRDAKGQEVAMRYDALGRLVERREAEGITTWRYDTAPGAGIGKPAGARQEDSDGGLVYAEAYAYTGFGETAQQVQVIDGRAYWVGQDYDNLGQPVLTRYPALAAPRLALDDEALPDPLARPAKDADSAFAVEQVYERGTLVAVKTPAHLVSNTNPETAYWALETADADGRVTRAALGNRLKTRHAYDRARGVLEQVRTARGSATPVHEAHYRWDLAGNLLERHDPLLGHTETFAYDALYRLTESVYDPGVEQAVQREAYAYDAIGNLRQKGAHVRDYAYGMPDGRLPHAVREVAVQTANGWQTRSYTYDANGNLVEGGGNTVTWASYNKPIQITDTQTGYSSAFAYGPDRARVLHVAHTAEGERITRYVGGLYEAETRHSGQPDAATEHRYHIRAGGQVIALHSVTVAGEGLAEAAEEDDDPLAVPILEHATRYLHRDHLGSIAVITDAQGEVLERLGYDAWGKRRAVGEASGPLPGRFLNATLLDRGYTGHEHLDHVGLIHMNGRVYDPELGRFLSADPFVQFPASITMRKPDSTTTTSAATIQALEDISAPTPSDL